MSLPTRYKRFIFIVCGTNVTFFLLLPNLCKAAFVCDWHAWDFVADALGYVISDLSHRYIDMKSELSIYSNVNIRCLFGLYTWFML